MKNAFALLVFLLISIGVLCQSAQIDALERKLSAAKENSTKVEILHDLIELYFYKGSDEFKQQQKDQIIKYEQDALDLSVNLGYRKGEYIAYRNFSDIYKYYGMAKSFVQYQFKYKQNKKNLDAILAQEIELIKKQQTEKEAEILALEQDKNLNKELIEQKKAELNATKGQLSSTMGKIQEKDRLISLKENVIVEKQNELVASHDSIKEQNKINEEQNKINQTLQFENKILEDERQIMALSAKAERAKNWMYFMMGIVALVLAAFFGILIIAMKRNHSKLKEKNDLIASEKARSDELLLNILPIEMAKELKLNGFAKAQSFSNVTVFFSDFKDFTKISEQLSPSELVEELDVCFKAFDRIIEKYDIEKIKTVGDAYICAAGLDKTKKHTPEDIIRAALEIRDFVLNRVAKRKKENKLFFEARIGVHTGPIVAGIVGFKKFAYDIWGDTVNTAARMEQHGAPGEVNISAQTFELVKDKFTFTHRGKIEAKNKGEIEMYFIKEAIS